MIAGRSGAGVSLPAGVRSSFGSPDTAPDERADELGDGRMTTPMSGWTQVS
jgi:hypothetical protein